MRLIAKNIPPEAREEEIKAHFSAIGAPTDVRVLTTPAGVSRRVAFIGYKTEDETDVLLEELSYL